MIIAITMLLLFVVGLSVGLTLGVGIGTHAYEGYSYDDTPAADKTIHMETITIDNGKFYKKI